MSKVCAADLHRVIAKFEGTFDTLWNDPEFEAWTPDDPTSFLGRAVCETHVGDRPIAITWKLDHAKPPEPFERYATLAPG